MAVIRNEVGLSLDDILLVPQFNPVKSRLDTDTTSRLTTDIKIGIPLMATNMSTVTEYSMAKTLSEYGGVGAVHRFNTVDDQQAIVAQLKESGVDNIVASIGVGADEITRAKELVSAGANVILIDVAHGHTQQVMEELRYLKEHVDAQYIVGNIATGAAAKYFLEAGANGLRVGIGGGSRCTTRKVTGHGVPNLTALMDVVLARDIYLQDHMFYSSVIIDGGIKNSGDIVKALAFGADVACIGNLFAGTDEAPGDFIETTQGKFKKFYGMSSKDAQDIHKGGIKKGIAAEGFSELVPYKGSVRPIIEELVGGIRSGLTYSGAFNINELQERAEAVRLSVASQGESKLR